MKPHLRVVFLSNLLIALASFSSAKGNDYAYSGTIDLSALSESTGTGFPAQVTYSAAVDGPPPSLTLGQGDTVTGTVLFDNNEALSVQTGGNLTSLQFNLLASQQNPGFPAFTSTFTLLGVEGNLDAPNPSSDTQTGVNTVAAEDPNIANSTFSFTGFTYSITLTGGAPTSYTPNAFFIMNPSQVSVVAAPEPSTLGLLIFGCLGAFSLRCSRFCRALSA